MTTILSNGSSLLVVEAKSISVGYELLQNFSSASAHLLEAFPTLTGNFVILLNGHKNDLLKNHKELPKKDLIDSAVIENVNEHVLKGFYNLLKISPRDDVLVIETKTLCEAFRISASAVNTGLEIVELRSARSLVGINLLVLTGPKSSLQKIVRALKGNKKIKAFRIIEIGDSFRRFFSFL